VADLRSDAAERVADEIGQAAISVTADVGSAADVSTVVSETVRRFGAPNILVNNAGTTHRNQPLLETDEASFDRVFRVNVKSIYHFMHAAVPVMRDAGGGVILNVGSTAGIRPRPGLTWYNASKGAVNLMSRSLAVELAPWNIRVNALCPVAGEYAGEPSEIYRQRSARPALSPIRRCSGSPLSCLGRSGIHHRGRVSDRRGPNHLSIVRESSLSRGTASTSVKPNGCYRLRYQDPRLSARPIRKRSSSELHAPNSCFAEQSCPPVHIDYCYQALTNLVF